MLNKIIHFSLQNRLLVLVASILLLVGGTYMAFHTEVDVFPDLNAPTVVVMTEANGMAAEEVEQLVTFPIETAVNGATGVRRVRSSSTTPLRIALHEKTGLTTWVRPVGWHALPGITSCARQWPSRPCPPDPCRSGASTWHRRSGWHRQTPCAVRRSGPPLPRPGCPAP